jgi:hypothetical protein
MGERAEDSQSDKTPQAEAQASQARTVAPVLMGTRSVAYSGPRDRIGRVSTMFANVGGSAAAADRHAANSMLPNIEPDAGKDLDTLAEAKAHT